MNKKKKINLRVKEEEKDSWVKFTKSNTYLLMVKSKVLSSPEARPKIDQAIMACFEEYKKKEEIIKILKETK